MDYVLPLTIIVLVLFAGSEIITKVPPTLHTPVMSGTNAVSGIVLAGALASSQMGLSRLATWLGMAAIVLAVINVVGGFLVTHRVFSMFRRKE